MKRAISPFSKVLATALLTLGLSTQGLADAGRPKVGLVLGGGGARGAAHIGVLEVLEELRVPIDCIAGTSMGALVAGTYAAGLSPATMRARVAEADWTDMFIDYPDYDKVSFRYKEILRRSIPGSETGVSADGIKYPPSIIGGEKIKLFFNELVGAGRSERLIEKLPLPLSIIATDIGTGERVVLRDGRLTVAMRASMSVPGLLAPVRLGDHHLVDGGLVDNVPIAEVRQRCNPDVVIAVNVGSPLMKADDVNSLLSVSAQMVNILTEQNVTRSLATLKPSDIYIKPDLGTITAGDFGRNAEAADRGRAAAESVRAQLARLSTSPDRYAEWRAPIDATNRGPTRVDEIQIVGLNRVNPAMVAKELQFANGDEVRQSEVTRDALKIFGQGTFESVDYEMLRLRDRNILRLLPVEKGWGPDYLRFALNLETDTAGDPGFGIRVAYQKTLMNELGAELLTSVDIGNTPGAAVNFYQPLDPAQNFFVAAGMDYQRNTAPVYENGEKLAQYYVGRGSAGAWLGANLGTLGQARLGATENTCASIAISAPTTGRKGTPIISAGRPTSRWTSSTASISRPRAGAPTLTTSIHPTPDSRGCISPSTARHRSATRWACSVSVTPARSAGGCRFMIRRHWVASTTWPPSPRARSPVTTSITWASASNTSSASCPSASTATCASACCSRARMSASTTRKPTSRGPISSTRRRSISGVRRRSARSTWVTATRLTAVPTCTFRSAFRSAFARGDAHPSSLA